VWSVGEKVLSVSLDGPGETFTAITSERIRVRRRDGTVRTLERSTIGPEAEPLGRDLKSAKIVLSASPDRVSRYFVWDLDGPSAIQPVELRAHPSASGVTSADMHPKGTWVATAGPREVAFWPLAQPHARIIPSRVGGAFSAPILFTPDSRHLLSCGNQGGFNRWSLRPEETSAHLLDFCLTQAVDRVHSRFIAAGNKIFLLSQDGGPPRTLLELPVGTYAVAAAFHPSMDLAAVYRKEPQEAAPREIKVFDLHSGNIASLPVETFDAFAVRNLAFAFDGALYSAGNGGIRRWDLTKRKVETFRPAQNSMMAMSGNGRFILAAFGGSRWGRTDKVGGDLILFDLERSSQRRITTHGSDFHSLAIDETGNVIATKDASGIVRVGKASGGQPHVLLNGGGGGGGLAISPDGKWVATRTESNIVLWPMPDLSETPLHVLPHDQLVSKLHNLTNLRAVADQTSSTGYKVEIGPFPGWKDAPTW
jgi:WD40 repeat protein